VSRSARAENSAIAPSAFAGLSQLFTRLKQVPVRIATGKGAKAQQIGLKKQVRPVEPIA
jgi:hypothetical protein